MWFHVLSSFHHGHLLAILEVGSVAIGYRTVRGLLEGRRPTVLNSVGLLKSFNPTESLANEFVFSKESIG